MSSAKLKFNCAHGESNSFVVFAVRSPLREPALPPPPSSFSFFRIPSLSGRSFCAARFYSTGARRITRRVVCDNDNQRVKWGLIFFRRGGEWRRRETRIEAQGGERRKENACIHLPRNTQACTQHRRTLCGLSSTEKGTNGGRGGEGGEKRGEKRVNARAWTGTQEYPEHARTTCNWVQSSWFSCEMFLRPRRSIDTR